MKSLIVVILALLLAQQWLHADDRLLEFEKAYQNCQVAQKNLSQELKKSRLKKESIGELKKQILDHDAKIDHLNKLYIYTRHPNRNVLSGGDIERGLTTLFRRKIYFVDQKGKKRRISLAFAEKLAEYFYEGLDDLADKQDRQRRPRVNVLGPDLKEGGQYIYDRDASSLMTSNFFKVMLIAQSHSEQSHFVSWIKRIRKELMGKQLVIGDLSAMDSTLASKWPKVYRPQIGKKIIATEKKIELLKEKIKKLENGQEKSLLAECGQVIGEAQQLFADIRETEENINRAGGSRNGNYFKMKAANEFTPNLSRLTNQLLEKSAEVQSTQK